MAWNTPSTWLAGAVLTAAQLNAQLRDNFKAIGDPWTAYTPALTGITLGNGTLVAAYSQAGKLVQFRAQLTVGSTTSFGVTNTIGLPVSCVSFRWRFSGEAFDNGTANYPISGRVSPTTSTTRMELVYRSTAALNDQLVTGSAPFTLGSGDVISISGTYEAA